MNFNPSGEFDDLAPHLEYFAERSNLLFSAHFFAIEFQEDEDISEDPHENGRTWMLMTIQNACLHASLLALRDLDDFFTPREDKKGKGKRSRPDDLKASDFGLHESMSFLAGEERTAIDKQIVHTTTVGVFSSSQQWDLSELISKAVYQCDTFLEWIKTNYGPNHFNTWTAALVTQSKTKAIFEYIHDFSKKNKKQNKA